MAINTGGPAFPVIPPLSNFGSGQPAGYPYPDAGMTLRDAFAIAALPGAIADRRSELADEGSAIDWQKRDAEAWPRSDTLIIAERSYALADAMLAAREVDHG